MRHRLRGVIQAFAVFCILANPIIAQSSAHYRTERVVLAAGAAAASSASFETSVILSPETSIGASSTCNRGYRVSLGTMPFAGTIPVPIDLSVRHSQSDPQDVELTWTGADADFRVYRGSSASALSNTFNLYEETDLCGFTDISAQQEPVIFYLVMPRP